MISTFQSSRFNRKPTYTCRICKKTTRETGHDESSVKLCAFCFREAELENSLNDGAIDQAQYDAALIELEREYKRGAFAKTTKTSEPVETKPVAKPTKKLAPSQTPSAKNARRIIRKYLRTAIEFTMDENVTDVALIEAMAAAEEALSTIPGYEA